MSEVSLECPNPSSSSLESIRPTPIIRLLESLFSHSPPSLNKERVSDLSTHLSPLPVLESPAPTPCLSSLEPESPVSDPSPTGPDEPRATLPPILHIYFSLSFVNNLLEHP